MPHCRLREVRAHHNQLQVVDTSMATFWRQDVTVHAAIYSPSASLPPQNRFVRQNVTNYSSNDDQNDNDTYFMISRQATGQVTKTTIVAINISHSAIHN